MPLAQNVSVLDVSAVAVLLCVVWSIPRLTSTFHPCQREGATCARETVPAELNSATRREERAFEEVAGIFTDIADLWARITAYRDFHGPAGALRSRSC